MILAQNKNGKKTVALKALSHGLAAILNWGKHGGKFSVKMAVRVKGFLAKKAQINLRVQ